MLVMIWLKFVYIYLYREIVSPRRDTMALERSGARSPTAELERAVRDQLHYSHTLDEDIMDQVTNAEHLHDIFNFARCLISSWVLLFSSSSRKFA